MSTRFISSAKNYCTTITVHESDGTSKEVSIRFNDSNYFASDLETAALKLHPSYLKQFYTLEDARTGKVLANKIFVPPSTLAAQANKDASLQAAELINLKNEVAALKARNKILEDSNASLLAENDHIKRELVSAGILNDTPVEVLEEMTNFKEMPSTDNDLNF